MTSRAASDDWQAAQNVSNFQPDGTAAVPRYHMVGRHNTHHLLQLLPGQLQRRLRGLQRRSRSNNRVSCMQASTYSRVPRIRRLAILQRPRCPVDGAFLMQTTLNPCSLPLRVVVRVDAPCMGITPHNGVNSRITRLDFPTYRSPFVLQFFDSLMRHDYPFYSQSTKFDVFEHFQWHITSERRVLPALLLA